MLTKIALISLLSGAINAAFVGDLQPRACNADNCYRAIFASITPGQVAKGSADCASFLAKTASQCVVTVTASSTLSVPITTSTVIVSAQTTSFQTFYTASPLVLVTTVVTQTAAAAKRDVQVNGIEKRTVTTCAATQVPSNVPKYASACSGTARFSSACACAGVSATINTLSVQTTTVTATTQVPYTVTETSTTTSLVIIPTTVATPSTSTVTQTTTVQPANALGTSCAAANAVANPYVAANGKQFQTLCNSDYYHTAQLGYVTGISFTKCLDVCSTTVGCNFVDYFRPPQTGCLLLTAQNGYYSTNIQSADSAYLLPPYEPYTVIPDDGF